MFSWVFITIKFFVFVLFASFPGRIDKVVCQSVKNKQ